MSSMSCMVFAILLSASPQTPKSSFEVPPADPLAAKVVLIGGSNFYKAGEHEYIPGCLVLADLLAQSPKVAPVVAADWPSKPQTLAGAKALVLFTDGGDKHPFLRKDRLAQVERLVEEGAGLVLLHQGIDIAKDFGDRFRGWTGGAWEKGHSQRAHWVAKFDRFPAHEIFRGVTPFEIDDGWLFRMRFVPNLKGVIPLLSTQSPKSKSPSDKAPPGPDAIVAWAYERPDGGRSVVFTGCHLHRSFDQEGYRRFLTQAILWSAKHEVPASGAPVKLSASGLDEYLKKRVGQQK